MTANEVLSPDFGEVETKPNPDEGLRQGLFEAQAARIVELQAEIASRQDEVDELKARILDSHPAGTYQATKYPEAYQLKPRPLSQLEKLLSADAVAGYAMSGKPTVVVS